MTDIIENILQNWFSALDDIDSMYLVGGVVRDSIMGRPVNDIDIVCKNAKDVARHIASSANAIVVPFEKKANEPCYRVIDRMDKDNFIDLSPIHQDGIEEDLHRRDFTVNAMAIRVNARGKLQEIVDPLGGTADLKEKIIRVASSAAFENDPLRMLRAYRFASEFGFTLSRATDRLIVQQAELMKTIPGERIHAELLKVFSNPDTLKYIRLMDESGLLSVLFPEIEPMKGCNQNAYHHKDVWEHSMLVLGHLEKLLESLADEFKSHAHEIRKNLQANHRKALLKFTALFHDIGKPSTKNVKSENGGITFYGHHIVGKEMMVDIAQRLRMSVRDREFVRVLLEEHLHVWIFTAPEVKKSTKMRLIRKMGDDIVPLLLLGIADKQSTLGPASSLSERGRQIDGMKQYVIRYYEKIKNDIAQRDIINGRDLIAVGIPPGPRMGKILNRIKELRDDGNIKTKQEALDKAKTLYLEGLQ